uniref:MIF4G domain-containing protein n=1 Tax=Salix viminalis TaxID=40686 RepID=A0A6N2N598_SALVM
MVIQLGLRVERTLHHLQQGKIPMPEALWDDEDTRAFYECLPDLSICPAVLLGEAEPKANEHSVKTQDQSMPPVYLFCSRLLLWFFCENELATESDQANPPKIWQRFLQSLALCGREKEKDPEKEKGKEKDAERKGENDKEKLKSLEGANLDALLQRLPGCVSRDLIDQLTVDFCYVNQAKRRSLTSLELLPNYSRMVATLSTCMKDVSSMLLQMLEEEFNFLINKKDQMNIETKIRNIRFIGELCKFRIAPASTVFSCLKVVIGHENYSASRYSNGQKLTPIDEEQKALLQGKA